jgi:hypothetical protein
MRENIAAKICVKLKLYSRWPEVISNHHVWGKPSRISYEQKLKKEKCKWIGHTLRKPPSDITKAALKRNPQVTRKRGRHRTT